MLWRQEDKQIINSWPQVASNAVNKKKKWAGHNNREKRKNGIDGRVRKGLFKGIIVLLGGNVCKGPMAEVCIRGSSFLWEGKTLGSYLYDGACHLSLKLSHGKPNHWTDYSLPSSKVRKPIKGSMWEQKKTPFPNQIDLVQNHINRISATWVIIDKVHWHKLDMNNTYIMNGTFDEGGITWVYGKAHSRYPRYVDWTCYF